MTFPPPAAAVNRAEPVPRRVRAVLGGETILDTVGATYLWEQPHYPQFYVPAGDLAPGVLGDPVRREETAQGDVDVCPVTAGGLTRPEGARVVVATGLVRLTFAEMDAWFEEDEQIFVHPRNPYTRVDALRTTRRVEVSLDGVVLASAPSAVAVFETGLPTRWYVDKSCVDLAQLEPSATRTECPYKGRVSEYWHVRTPKRVHHDVAWCYAFPTVALAPIAGLVAFLNEKVDLMLDGVAVPR